jgi:superfamily II DNA or RNA helicase
MDLRPYQLSAVSAYQAALADKVRRSLIVLPTGTGKTVVGLRIAREVGGRCLWLAHREELLDQPLRTLPHVWPVRGGVVKAARDDCRAQVVFGSVATLRNEARLDRCGLFDFVVVDEAHHAPAESYRMILERLGCFTSGPPILGLSATPERADKQQLDQIFESVCYSYPLRSAIEQGYLVAVKMEARPIAVDLDAIKQRAGDFETSELALSLLRAGIVEQVALAVRELAADRRTLVFTVSVDQARLTAEALTAAGVSASWVAGELATSERRARITAFAAGRIRVLCNCMVLTEGFDDPGVECIAMARPTQSKSLYVQCVGRGLRIAPGKADCLLIDMVGLSRRHTLIQAPIIFGEEAGLEARRAADAALTAEKDEEIRLRHWAPIMIHQVVGLQGFSRSSMSWVRTEDGRLAMSCGKFGTLRISPDADLWTVDVVGRREGASREALTVEPVDLEFAQGLAEDYVRRIGVTSIAIKEASWRLRPASDKQIAALKRCGVAVPSTLTAGEASDALTASAAASKGHDPATPKQIAYLARLGIETEEGITKREAGRLIAGARGE